MATPALDGERKNISGDASDGSDNAGLVAGSGNAGLRTATNPKPERKQLRFFSGFVRKVGLVFFSTPKTKA